MDGRTDGPRDTPSCKDAKMHLKYGFKIVKIGLINFVHLYFGFDFPLSGFKRELGIPQMGKEVKVNDVNDGQRWSTMRPQTDGSTVERISPSFD